MVKKGAHLGGIRTVDDLMARCYVDDESGCWHWRLCISQGVARVNVKNANGDQERMRGRRAALLLHRGEDLPEGHFAFATHRCKSTDCVNPEHCRSGTRQQHGKSLAASGRVKGVKSKQDANRRIAEKKRRFTSEQVKDIRTGAKSDAEWARELNVSRFAVWSARHGKTYAHVPLAPTSVFDLARTL